MISSGATIQGSSVTLCYNGIKQMRTGWGLILKMSAVISLNGEGSLFVWELNAPPELSLVCPHNVTGMFFEGYNIARTWQQHACLHSETTTGKCFSVPCNRLVNDCPSLLFRVEMKMFGGTDYGLWKEECSPLRSRELSLPGSVRVRLDCDSQREYAQSMEK